MTKIIVALFVALFATAARPETPGDLYTGTAFVTGQYEDNRGAGFARALEDVLAKVSGDGRLVGDPRVTDIVSNAGRYVASFSYRDRMASIPVHDEQGTRERPYELTVVFAEETIDALLTGLGQKPWTERPEVVVIADITPGGGSPYRLTRGGTHGRDLREALAAESRRVGLHSVLPSSDEAVSAATADVVSLSGAIVWSDAALGWTADWSFSFGGRDYAWQVAGVSFDAAFRSGLRGVAQVLSGNGAPPGAAALP